MRRQLEARGICVLLIPVALAGCVSEPPAPPPPPPEPVVVEAPPPPPPEPKEPQDWIEELTATDPAVRLEAADQLADAVSWVPSAIPELTEALADADPAVRRSAARALGRIAPWAATAEPALMTLLEDPDAEVRLEGVAGLARLRSPGTVDGLERSLRDTDPRVRMAAARALIELVPRTRTPVPVLAEALENGSLAERLEAVELLSKLGRPAAGALVIALDDENPRVRVAATDALWWLGPDAATALISALDDGSPRVRRAAVRAMRDLVNKTPRVIPHLEEALRDEDAVVRQLASKALAVIGTESKVNLLVMDLDSEDLGERRGASEALIEMGEVAAPALATTLTSGDEEERASAARVMRDVVEPDTPEDDSLRPLVEALADAQVDVRMHASEALGKMGPGAAPAVGDLETVLKDDVDPSVRRSAAWALGRIGEAEPSAVEAALPALYGATRDADDRVRARAVEALGRIGAPAREGASALVACLEDEDPLVRGWSAWALGRVGPELPEAVEALRRATEDPDPDVREFAVRALSKAEGS